MNTKTNAPAKTYTWRIAITSLLYTLTVFGINIADDNLTLSQGIRISLSLLPLIPAILMMMSIVIFIRSMDEVWQRIMTESSLISAGIVGFACFTYGFLEGAMELPTISLIWVLPALIAFQGVSVIFVKRLYR